LVWTYRFDDGRFKKLWAALTGDSAEKLSREESWWSAYAGHIKLRHDVVHGGATATAQQAERSIEGVLGAINYGQNTMVRIGVELGHLREVGTPGRPRQRLLTTIVKTRASSALPNASPPARRRRQGGPGPEVGNPLGERASGR
jgi:hypothetical protein